MRQQLLAYGYKPADLIQITAQDVFDFHKGLSARMNVEWEQMITAAEVAAGTKVRKKKEMRRYSNKVRQMIEEQDRKDRELGKIK